MKDLFISVHFVSSMVLSTSRDPSTRCLVVGLSMASAGELKEGNTARGLAHSGVMARLQEGGSEGLSFIISTTESLPSDDARTAAFARCASLSALIRSISPNGCEDAAE
mmetsp:Transcript_28623/g.84323  ORF Transcript_28623/g.84323 Transcript_28623/m.84323 type:complete len:109 (+) Transcript_28623:299-625(+)